MLDARPLGLTWAVINLLSLWIALRACWDPAAQDPAPWQGACLPGVLEDHAGQSQECRITALSESGAELEIATPTFAAMPLMTLHWTDEVPPLAVELERMQGNRVSLRWQQLDDQSRQRLILWLFCREDCWPDRQALPEWRSFLALISNLCTLPTRRPFHRCLMPQTTPH
jgi:cellulose synthase (UDP-forming)